ncbi:hypothetical protein [Shimia sagamensis]|uniref:SMP-30/Gluconolaconase/LRE-like region n=1 Tax=Shimia sagamensis TaxID=1566352 RepID=A0ABY1P0X5_9RHOB|nr:hypothetical protein [Shimia sagamensis]SMP23684.1 hypothetical protein SAMN06265373_104400 [Shimia sagamensis]
MKNILPTLTAGTLCIATSVLADPSGWTSGAFDMPESAIYDEARDRIVVSVIAGHPGEADGNGALALLSPEGDVIDPNWITGLNAPKGMAILENTLLVADLTQLHEVNLTTGTLQHSWEVDGAVFLNDIASDTKKAYISDFMANQIWRYEAGEITSWLVSDTLSHPNGLYLDGDELLVGSWGQGMQSDFSTEHPGSLLAVNLDDQEISVIAEQVGNLDGIARIGDKLFVNDWITGDLFEVQADGSVASVAKFAPGLADIAAFGNALLLPSMLEGTISMQSFP